MLDSDFARISAYVALYGGIPSILVGLILRVVYAREDVLRKRMDNQAEREKKLRHDIRSEAQVQVTQAVTDKLEAKAATAEAKKENAILQAEVHDLFRRNVRYANRVEYLEGELTEHEIEFRPWSEMEPPKLPPAEEPP